MASGDFADYGADVSALRVLHGDRPEDDGEVEELAMHRRFSGGVCGDVAAAESGGLRAVVCAVHRWTNGDVD